MKMNVFTNTWLGIVSLSGVLIAPPQHALAQTDQDLIEVARAVVASDRKTVVVAAMELTDSEAKSSGRFIASTARPWIRFPTNA